MFSGSFAKGQGCSGNFGKNIFESGDFGSGTAQTLQNDPQIAPGYIYTTSLPPSDGYYTLTNLMRQNEIYGDWLPIGDFSDDANGYMMVVNASNEPGLFYEQTITGLCEDVLYEFSADIINLVRASSTDRIDPNVSFYWTGKSFTLPEIFLRQNVGLSMDLPSALRLAKHHCTFPFEITHLVVLVMT